MTGEDRLRDWLESCRAEVERYERLLEREDLPRERYPYLNRQLSKEVELLAITDLLLDENDPQELFGRAARLSVEGVVEGREFAGEHGTGSSPGLWRGMRSAFLGDDGERLERVQDEIATLPPRYPDRFPELAASYRGLRAVDALLDDERERAAGEVEKLRRHADAQDLNNSSGTVIDGFLDDDPEVIESGIRGLCAFQRTQMPENPDHQIRGDGLSRNALFFYTLAHEWGYDVDVADEPLLELPPWVTTNHDR